MRTIIALLAGALIIGGSAAAQQDYVDAEPAPVGQAVQLDASQVTVTVTGVTVTDDPAALIGRLGPEEVAPGDVGVVVELAITNGGAEAFRPGDVFNWRLVDADGVERKQPPGVSECGAPEMTWVQYGNIRPGRTATITVCWVLPGSLLDGAHLEMRYAAGAGLFHPISLDPATAVASPVASPMSPPKHI